MRVNLYCHYAYMLCLLAGFAHLSVCAPAEAQTVSKDSKSSNWLDEVRWGTMSHYLSDWMVRDEIGGRKLPAECVVRGPMTPAKWNELIDEFDVEALADQLAGIGVDYHVFTLSQCGGYYASPNAAYDRIVGRDAKTSWFPKRDLIADLGNALHKRDIRLIVYIAHEPPIRGDDEATVKLRPAGQPHPENGEPMSKNEAWRVFTGHWEQVVEEYAERWGDRVDGWWFDGCWFGQLGYADAPNDDSLVAVLKKANPKAVISFNHHFKNLRGQGPPAEDYFAGEIGKPEVRMIMSPRYGQRNTNRQMLTYLGRNWGPSSTPRYTPEELVVINRRLLHHGGVVTWDVPTGVDGTLLKSFLPHLRAISKVAKEDPIALWRERSEGKLVPKGNLAFKRPAYLASNKTLKGIHGFFPRVLPVGGPQKTGPRPAEQGVDGDPKTYAQPAGEWPWTYYVDLQEPHEVSRIEISFDPKYYATKFGIFTSPNGQHWEPLKNFSDHDGSPVRIELESPRKVRWVQVTALKPNKPDQPGSQMAIGELRAFR